jgi:hypothetical protein
VVTPAPAPETTPLVPIVAADVLVLNQVPPVAASVSVIVADEHKVVAPVMAGAALMVTTVVLIQPELPATE